MQYRFYYLILFFFCVNPGYSQSRFTEENIINLGQEQVWRHTDLNKKTNFYLPVFSENEKQFSIFTTFSIDTLLVYSQAYLHIPVYSGDFTIILNDKILGFQADDGLSKVIPVPVELLRFSGANSLELRFTEPGWSDYGYPSYGQLGKQHFILGLNNDISLHLFRGTGVQLEFTGLESSGNSVSLSGRLKLLAEPELLAGRTELNLKVKLTDGVSVIENQIIPVTADGEWQSQFRIKIPESRLWPETIIPPILTVSLDKNFSNVFYFEYPLKLKLAQFFKKIQINRKEPELRGFNLILNRESRLNGRYKSALKNILVNLKRSGFNLIRLPGHLPDDYLLSQCDSLGLSVFGELPLSRLLSADVSNEDLIALSKKTSEEAFAKLRYHPSLLAIGLGRELKLTDPVSEKFFHILGANAVHPGFCLIYMAPVPTPGQPRISLADFYLLDHYAPLSVIYPDLNISNYYSAGLFSFNKNPDKKDVQLNFRKTREVFGTSCLFYGNSQWSVNQSVDHFNKSGGLIYNPVPDIFDPEAGADISFWQRSESETILSPVLTASSNNYSILVFLTFILFILVYRRSVRLRSDLIRSLRNSNGFFMDIRERRIIPLHHSTFVGIVGAILLGTITAAVLSGHLNRYWVNEISYILLHPLGLYAYFQKISTNEFLLVLYLGGFYFLIPVFISALIYLFAFITGYTFRLRQAFAMALWSGSPLVLLFPPAFFSQYILDIFNLYSSAVYLIFVMIFWIHWRLIKGIRAIFYRRSTKVLLIVLLSYTIPVLIFWAIFKPDQQWYEYIRFMISTRSIF